MRARFVHSAAQLAGLTAIALVHAREHTAAQRWWRTAARAADAADDPQLQALIVGRQAVMSLYSDTPQTVLNHADRAISLAGNAAGVGAINGMAARAQMLARMGCDEEAKAALRDIHDLFPQIDHAWDDTTQWGWQEQRLRFVESEVHTYGGRVQEADQAQGAALALYPRSSWQGPAQIHAHRAAAFIGSGDIALGAAHLGNLLDQMQPWQRRNGLVQRSVVATLERVPREQRKMEPVRQVRALLEAAPSRS